MKSSEILTMLLYGLDIATRPTLKNMLQSGESWQRYHGLHASQLARLRAQGLVQRSGERGAWALALTDSGRMRALGGRDPEERWSRPWDGRWRLLFFDLDSSRAALRQRLLRWLRGHDFGLLQRSVWLSPDPRGALAEFLRDNGVPKGEALVFEGRPPDASAADAEIVGQAWDFDAINEAYADYLRFARSGVPAKPSVADAAHWAATETALWTAATRRDPLLPDALLPKSYPGRKAWAARRKLLRKASAVVSAASAEY